jgi:uncharacterized protein
MTTTTTKSTKKLEMACDQVDGADVLSQAAYRRLQETEGGPAFFNDWVRALFIHYEVDAQQLQKLVPFELDLRDGKAYVSLVAFSIKRLRPSMGGRITEWLSRPVSNHGFFNVRTYVKHEGEPGIQFLSEWLSNRLSVLIGPRTFGLPYRYGKLDYAHDHEMDRGGGEALITGNVTPVPGNGYVQLRYETAVDVDADYQPCEAGTLDAFLLERYTAYTCRRGVKRRFRIAHDPWPAVAVDAQVFDDGLLALSGDWAEDAKQVAANYTPGVKDIWVGKPACIAGKHCGRVWHDAR